MSAITVAEMYITLLPAIFAGIFNMVWCRTPFLPFLRRPMDNGRRLGDGNRIFGDNKTWKGFLGMILLGAIFTILWGLICGHRGFLYAHNYIYRLHANTALYNLIIGLSYGFAYALFELPNSFLKRRLGIAPGKPLKGWQGIFFVFLDQADSVFGMVLVVAAVYRMSIWFYFFYVLLGAATHIVFNMLLYAARLRENLF